MSDDEVSKINRYVLSKSFVAVDEETGTVFVTSRDGSTIGVERPQDTFFLAYVPQADGSYVRKELKDGRAEEDRRRGPGSSFKYDQKNRRFHYQYDPESFTCFGYIDLLPENVESGLVIPNNFHCSYRRVRALQRVGNKVIYSRSLAEGGKYHGTYIRDLTDTEIADIAAGKSIALHNEKDASVPNPDPIAIGSSTSVKDMAFLTTKLQCPTSGKLLRGVCGCDTPDEDKDMDGVIDCKDSDKGAGTNVHFDALKKQ